MIRHTPKKPASRDLWPDNARPLPVAFRDWLGSGSGEGSRNDDAHKWAQQMRDCEYSQSEAEAMILPRSISDGLAEGEAKQAISSAFKQSKREPITPGASDGKSSPVRPDEPDVIKALRAAFRPDERIAIVPAFWNIDSQKWTPGKASIHTIDAWAKRLPDSLDKCAGGCFIGINPLVKGAEKRLRDSVAVYRHVLVEWEDGSTLEAQAQRIRDSSLPVSVMVTSGGRSVHAWVNVAGAETLTLPQWEKRRDIIFERLNCDRKNKDVSRVSRLPGFFRGENEQKLLAVSFGARSWHEWAKANGLENADALPPIVSLRGFLMGDHEEPPEVISGLLHKGCKMVLGAPSKARKSWALQDMALSVAAGWDWLGMKTSRGPVLYINLEIPDWALFKRLGKIGMGRGIQLLGDSADNLDVWNLRGFTPSIFDVVPRIIARIADKRYMVVIIDPAYAMLGEMDENAAGDMARFFAELERICTTTGAALVIAHHFAKGNSHDKNPADRLSGSGVYARNPDSLLIFTPPERERAKKGEEQKEPDDSVYQVTAILRNHPPCPVKRVRWCGHHYEAEGKVEPRDEGYASSYGKAFSFMPKLKHDAKNPDKCEVVKWALESFRAMNLDAEKAAQIFHAIRHPRHGHIKSLGDCFYIGSDYSDSEPY